MRHLSDVRGRVENLPWGCHSNQNLTRPDMLPDPLHPAIVHLPLALAVILPLLIGFALLKIKRGASASDVWMPVVILSFLMFAGTLAATNTGESEEEIVEDVVPESVIHVHEERAEAFMWSAGVVFLITAFGFMSARYGNMSRYLAAAGSVVVLVLALRTGHSGGELVYKHGAASVERPTSSSVLDTGRSSRYEDDDDDE